MINVIWGRRLFEILERFLEEPVRAVIGGLRMTGCNASLRLIC